MKTLTMLVCALVLSACGVGAVRAQDQWTQLCELFPAYASALRAQDTARAQQVADEILQSFPEEDPRDEFSIALREAAQAAKDGDDFDELNSFASANECERPLG